VPLALCLFHRIPQAIQDEVKQVFCLPLDELLDIQWIIQHGSFSSCCHVDVCVILENVILVRERFLPALGGLWQVTGLFFKMSTLVPHVFPLPPFFWTILQTFVFINV
jgi:hypothetical protein